MKTFITYGLFVISVGLLLADKLTNLEINSTALTAVLVFTALSAFLIMLGGMVKISSKVGLYVASALVSISIVYLVYPFFRADWKTQTILYSHGHFERCTIEFQMRDLGAWGYDRRTVKRTRILPCINIIRDAGDIKKITIPWIRVDIDVNELGLKGG